MNRFYLRLLSLTEHLIFKLICIILPFLFLIFRIRECAFIKMYSQSIEALMTGKVRSSTATLTGILEGDNVSKEVLLKQES